jgi:tetratricopeptide (TPR) repeat protein
MAMFARRSVVVVVLAVLLGGACVPLRAAELSVAPPATQPEHAYFPVKAGTTWKYLVSIEVDGKPAKPYVETVTAGEAVAAGGGRVLAPLEEDVYEIKSDGVFLTGHRDRAGRITAAERARRVLPARVRTSEAWGDEDGRGGSTYTTCLGSQSIKTEAGEYQSQCVFTTGTSADGARQTDVYRYFARDVGLVREKTTERSKGPDGTSAVRETTRELMAFSAAGAVTLAAPLARPRPQAIGSDAVRGELLDPAGQPIAQAPLTLRRLDKPESQQLQTDLTGKFAAGGLDPAGSYSLVARLSGYQESEVPLHGQKHGPVLAAIMLKPATAPDSGGGASADALFAAGKKLATDGDHRGAIGKYGEALAVDPKNSSVMAYKAISQLALGQQREAQQTVEEALRINDKDAQAWEVAGQVKAAQGQANQARSLFDKAAQLSPKTAGAMYMDLAAALAARNDNGLAKEIESALKAAAGADPPSAEALFQLGQSYANAGKQEGKQYLQRYLEVSAKLPEAEQDKQKMQVAKQLMRALDILKQEK